MIPVTQSMIDDISPRPLSRLSYKIMGLNLIALIMLAAGILYLDKYRESLTSAETEILTTEARLYASLLSDNAVAENELDKKRAENFLTNFALQKSQKLRLFNSGGELMMDIEASDPKRGKEQALPGSVGYFISEGFADIVDLFLPNFKLPDYPKTAESDPSSFPDVDDALNGNTSLSAWRGKAGGLILSAAVPIKKKDATIGVLLVTRSDTEIERTFSAMRLDILKFFLGALLITLAFSLYLSGVIGHPLRKLAYAVENVRQGRADKNAIPDLSDRQDEIGELSIALRHMTSALQERMESIERFAADVAHELKNPLTSIRSAVETLPKIIRDEDRQKLMQIITHDLLRMDRLISDISLSSRLDAELPRDILQSVNLTAALQSVIDSYTGATAKIVTSGMDVKYMVEGHPLRLSQVFQNLLSNAISFSPPGQPISVSIFKTGKEKVQIDIDDFGPGIPAGAEDKIFERFYTERPQNFGNHSGLGLSIVRQILDAHDGEIHASNRIDENGRVIGARFSVILNQEEI